MSYENPYGRKEAHLFGKCLGLNDSKGFATQTNHPLPNDPNAGDTELIDCLNVTTTRDGALENVPPLVTVLTHSAALTSLSADKRFFYQDGINGMEWNGTNIFQRFPITDGPICHTPVDVRICNQGNIYKSTDVDPYLMVPATVGNNPNPETSRPLYGMPAYTSAFASNGLLYAVNATDSRFIQYSEDFHFDLWSLGDGFIGCQQPILQAGAIDSVKKEHPGNVVLLHDISVTVLLGTHPRDFQKKNYPCPVISGTLYSGFISKLLGFGHLFLCNDGVYLVDADGIISNLTIKTTSFLSSLNSVIYGVTVMDGKYLVYGNHCCLEYDFVTGTLLKRSAGPTAATTWKGISYLATGNLLQTFGTDDTLILPGLITLPYSRLGVDGAKSISDLYFTGSVRDSLTITCTDEHGMSWSKSVYDLGTVGNYRIKTPAKVMGNHLSFRLESTGPFRLEKLRAAFQPSKRSR